MRSASRSAALVAACVILVAASGVFAQDWPQWRGPDRDGKVSGFLAPQTWPKQLAEKWKVTVGAGDSTPALVGDRLYVFTRQGDDEVILCLSAADGKELRRDRYAAQAVTGPAAKHPGPRSSPAVAEGKVVTLGVGGVVSCLDAASGKVAWRNSDFADVPQYFTAMSPIIVDGMAVLHLGGKDGGAVVAFDLAKGSEKWKWTGDGPAYASPVLMTVAGTKQIVVQTAKNLVGLAAADGKLLWQVAAPAKQRFYNCATPIVDGQTVITTGQGAGTKALKIEKQGDAFAAKEIWSNPDLGTGFSTPVLRDGLLFGLSDGGNFFCMNASTGKTLWTGSDKFDRFGAVLGAGPVILGLPASGDLLAFKPSDKGYEEVARLKVSATPVYAHPVIAGKRVFVKGEDTLAMLEFE